MDCSLPTRFAAPLDSAVIFQGLNWQPVYPTRLSNCTGRGCARMTAAFPATEFIQNCRCQLMLSFALVEFFSDQTERRSS